MKAFRCSILLLTILCCNYLSAATIYVSEAGAGLFDGSSWANAFQGDALQMAINNASNGDSVWVACGTFYASNSNNRSSSFSMRNGVSIFGSFQGSELSLEERELACGPCSILSGNIGNPNLSDDNTYTIIVNNDLDNSAIIDGFEVRDGYDDRSVSNVENGLGGGIYNGGHGNGGSCSPTFRNMVIRNNFATFGAGMFNNGYLGGNSSPILYNCIIAFNIATGGGGGMDSYGWNSGNVAPILINCLMYGNHSDNRAGAIYCWGGRNGYCSTTITNSAFINNTSNNLAGGIIVDNSNGGTSTQFSGIAEINISNSILWGNTATSGPQFYILGTGNFNATYSNIDTIGQTSAHPIAGLGTGNLFQAPMFIDINNSIGMDNCWMTEDDGLNLAIASPNINAGNGFIGLANDLSNSPRISGESIDIGPYEHQLLDSVFWSGDDGTIWEDPSNWLPARAPDSTQHVTIPDNLTNYPIILDLPVSIRSLVLENNSEIQILGDGVLNLRSNQ